MNLRQLEILYAVIRCRTTVAAARELGLSQPAVSNAIKSLESRIGFPLFERINNRLFPTREARSLYEDAKPIFHHHRALETRLTDLRENKGGQIRIVATPPLGYGPIPAAIQQFVKRRPKARVFFDVRRLDQVMDSVEAHAVDLAFAMNMPERAGVNRTVFHRGRLVCVFQPGHPLAAKEVITPRDLDGHSLIALEPDTRLGKKLRECFHQAGQPYDFVVQVRYCLTACVLAQSGIGVAIVDSMSPNCGEKFELAVRPFEPDFPVIAYAAWSSSHPQSRLASTFMRIMSEGSKAGEAPREEAYPLPT